MRDLTPSEQHAAQRCAPLSPRERVALIAASGDTLRGSRILAARIAARHDALHKPERKD